MMTAKAITRYVATRLARPMTRAWTRQRPGIRVLMYHRVTRTRAYDQLAVSPERFEEQMAYLAARCRLLTLAQAVRELKRESPIAAGVAVTFDDGYLDNLTEALPILQRYRIPATLFVTAEFCEQRLRHPRYADAAGRLHLNWAELRGLAREPGISLGSHTLTHPYLSRQPASRVRDEIVRSRAVIQDQTGAAIDFFCYPSGDFGQREEECVREAGYEAAVSVRPGTNRDLTSRFHLRRTEVTDHDDAAELAAKLDGAYDPLHHLLHAKRRLAFARQRMRNRETIEEVA